MMPQMISAMRTAIRRPVRPTRSVCAIPGSALLVQAVDFPRCRQGHPAARSLPWRLTLSAEAAGIPLPRMPLPIGSQTLIGPQPTCQRSPGGTVIVVGTSGMVITDGSCGR
jgi:hypothetical protein